MIWILEFSISSTNNVKVINEIISELEQVGGKLESNHKGKEYYDVSMKFQKYIEHTIRSTIKTVVTKHNIPIDPTFEAPVYIEFFDEEIERNK